MNGVQPCDFNSSPVSSSSLVLTQPRTSAPAPPELAHSVRLASKPNCTWGVGKQVLTWAKSYFAGSYMMTWRLELLIGNAFAEGWSDPFLQTSGLAAGRILAANQTRAFSSNIRLWGMVWASQSFSSPQYADAANIGVLIAEGVFGSRTGSFIVEAVCVTGSRIG